jgi:hypothetical protein
MGQQQLTLEGLAAADRVSYGRQSVLAGQR